MHKYKRPADILIFFEHLTEIIELLSVDVCNTAASGQVVGIDAEKQYLVVIKVIIA